jgi:RHS repeat-associated protein
LSNQSGNIIESFIYDDTYGTILQHNKIAQTYNPYGYTGREFDCDELYYYRARYYDPTIQKFLSSDPIEFLSGDFNFYRYVGNDPVNYVDPSGLFILEILQGVVGVADSITFGGVSAVSEVINTQIYGAQIAQASRLQTQASTAYQVGETATDIATLPKTVLKKGAAKVYKATTKVEKQAVKKVEKKTASTKKEDGKKTKGKPRRKCGAIKTAKRIPKRSG